MLATPLVKTRSLTLVLICFSFVACDDGSGAPDYRSTGTSMRPELLPSNEQIIAAVYDSTYTVPEGFYVDERADTPRSYTLYHVKDISDSYELCTDDYLQALDWEGADNKSRLVNGHYVTSYENEKYFEFVRELFYRDDVSSVVELTSPGFARVFKCSAVNRDGVDRNLRNSYAGTLNSRPLTTRVVREFTEYMWQFAYFEISRRKVLRSFSTERIDAFEHTLLIAFTINQGHGQCDRIEVVEWIFSAERSSGAITRSFHFLFAIEARLVDGAPEFCS